MKYSVSTMVVLASLLGTTASHANNTAVENALANHSDLSMFYQAFMSTGVASELNENTEYTIFAPTNAAFTSISPRTYPCFYSEQCHAAVAAILRNHIVLQNKSVNLWSKWGGDIPTIGKRTLDVEEPYKGQYTVENYTVLYQMVSSESVRTQGEDVSLYQIDGVIASDQELSQFRSPVADIPGTVTEKTITTYHTRGIAPPVYSGYLVPGGHSASSPTYMGSEDDPIETTTVTHTSTGY